MLGISSANREVLREAVLEAAATSNDLLRRGQMGTVVMVYADGALEVEFADRSGRTYALVSLSRDELMLLRDAPDHAVA